MVKWRKRRLKTSMRRSGSCGFSGSHPMAKRKKRVLNFGG